MEDMDALFALYEDKDLTKYTEPLLEYEEEVNKQRAYIDHMYRYFGYGMWLVFLKDTGELIGRAGVEHRQIYDSDRTPINYDAHEECKLETVTELGYLIKKDYQGQGLATEVCQAILKYAEEELEIEEVNCFIQEGNTPSIKLAESLGFSYRETIVEQDRKMLRFIRKSHIIKH
jgi:RimJ/RimL family protein N-acetyltransferase